MIFFGKKKRKLSEEEVSELVDDLVERCVATTKRSFSSDKSLFDALERFVAKFEYGATLSFFIYHWHETHKHPSVRNNTTLLKLTESSISGCNPLFYGQPLNADELMENRRGIYKKAIIEQGTNDTLNIMTELFKAIVANSILNKKPSLFYDYGTSRSLLVELSVENNLDPLQDAYIDFEFKELVTQHLRPIIDKINLLHATRLTQ